DELQIPQIVLLAQRNEGVLVLRLDDLNLADQILPFGGQRQLQCHALPRRKQSGEGDTQGKSGRARKHSGFLGREGCDHRAIVREAAVSAELPGADRRRKALASRIEGFAAQRAQAAVLQQTTVRLGPTWMRRQKAAAKSAVNQAIEFQLP